MHLPNERIYREMRSEEGGAWFVPANNGKETAVLIKAPTTTLKALLSGSALSFVFGSRDGYLCSGVRIYDVPEAPLLLCRVQRHEEQHAALRKIATDGNVPVFLYNEMDVCVAWSDGKLAENKNPSFPEFLNCPQEFYVGEFIESHNTFLDSFCAIMDPTLQESNFTDFRTLEISVEHGPWTSNIVHFVGEHDAHSIILDDRDEGAVLEKAVWASLESVFSNNLHKSPQVHYGETHRELTDVMAHHQYGTFLIEAKDLSVFSAGTDRTRTRRLLGIQKQTMKAIGQLVGASKKAKNGEKITDLKGNILPLVLDKPFHCIVLISDLMHEGDWSKIVMALYEAMIETGDYFHVLDLSELVYLLKASGGKSELLDYNLMRRCQAFVDNRSVHLRCKIVVKKDVAQ
jgi:hypothetical protein